MEAALVCVIYLSNRYCTNPDKKPKSKCQKISVRRSYHGIPPVLACELFSSSPFSFLLFLERIATLHCVCLKLSSSPFDKEVHFISSIQIIKLCLGDRETIPSQPVSGASIFTAISFLGDDLVRSSGSQFLQLNGKAAKV